MCLEDWKIGQLTTGQMTQVPLTVTPQLLIGGSNLRRVLILFPHVTANWVCAFENATTEPPINVFTGNNPIVLNRDHHGDIVSRALFAWAIAADPTVSIYIANFSENELKGIVHEQYQHSR